MAGRLRTLLPAPALDPESEYQQINNASTTSVATVSRPKRHAVLAACNHCRRKKTRCDGLRPSCRKCLQQDLECEYHVNEGETVSTALKRKLGQTQEENDHYRELFQLIRDRPLDEAQEILHRIRASQNPAAILRSVRDADLLLLHSLSTIAQSDQRLVKLDEDALASAVIKVPARPWTSVAGDGVVSQLISDFFATDDLYFFPPLDRQAFVKDMQAGNTQQARFCSPLLVNAICAHRSFWSRSAKMLGVLTRRDMVEQFVSEAKKLLDNENGRATVNTVLALYYMYATLTFEGRDRAGNMYRYMTIDMLRRLNLTYHFSQLRSDSPEVAREQQVISRALWGLFVFESRICSMYRQRSFIKPPVIPRLFGSMRAGGSQSEWNVDMLGHPYQDSSAHLPQTPGILHAICDLSQLFYHVISHQCKPQKKDSTTSQMDHSTSGQHYAEWHAWWRDLPMNFRIDTNFTPQTVWLKSHANEVALNILNSLPPELVLSGHSMTIKQLILAHSRDEIELADRYCRRWGADTLLGRGQFIVLSSLARFLDDSSVHVHFSAAAQLLRFQSSAAPVVALLLQGVQALVWSLKFDLPADARQYFEQLELSGDVKDLPTSFILPELGDLYALASEDDESADQTANDISGLIARWSALTVDK